MACESLAGIFSHGTAKRLIQEDSLVFLLLLSAFPSLCLYAQVCPPLTVSQSAPSLSLSPSLSSRRRHQPAAWDRHSPGSEAFRDLFFRFGFGSGVRASMLVNPPARPWLCLRPSSTLMMVRDQTAIMTNKTLLFTFVDFHLSNNHTHTYIPLVIMSLLEQPLHHFKTVLSLVAYIS